MNIIAVADENWGIGNRGDLLIRIPLEEKTFRQEIRGKVIVYGRNTLALLPQGLPLEGSKNMILSRDRNYQVKNAQVVNSIEQLLQELAGYDSQDVYIVGGESIFAQLLPYCDTAHITRIERAYEANAFLPDLDQMPEWKLVEESEEQTYFDTVYYFVKYRK